MSILDQLLTLAQNHIWAPGLIVALLAGGICWMFFRSPKLAAEPVIASVQATVAPKTKDQRGTFRRCGNPIEVHVVTADDREHPSVGSLLDRSMGGMRLALFHEIDIGSVISIKPLNANEMVPWVDLEIKSCRPSVEMPGKFDIGCQYVKTPPYSIQLLFG